MERLFYGLEFWEFILIAVIFIVWFGLLILGIVKPSHGAEWSARYFKWSMKILGFEADVRVTPRAIFCCRTIAVIMVVFLVMIIVFLAYGS